MTKQNEIAEAIENSFTSANVINEEHEPANLVDVLDRAARNLKRVANAISPQDALPLNVDGGGAVGSLAEAVVYAAENLGRIAAAIDDLASAVRESRG